MRNYGGGYVNHIIYWAPLCPHVHSSGKPEGELWEDIEAAFGSFEVFISRFLSAATGVFGSGYCWLVEDTEGTLSIQTTANQVTCTIHFFTINYH